MINKDNPMLKPKIKAKQLKVKYSQPVKKSSKPQIQAEKIKPVKYQQFLYETDLPESQSHAEPVIPVKYQHDVEVDTTELEQPSQLPFMILGISFLLGIIGVFLFQNHSWGFNLSLFIFLLAISLLVVRKLVQQPLSSSQYLLIATGLFFAITLIWRQSLILNSLSFFGLFLTIYLAYTLSTRQQQSSLDIPEAIQDFFSLIKYVISSYYQFMTQEIPWEQVKPYWKPYVRAIFTGLIITVPLLLILAVLLIQVDFNQILQTVRELRDWETVLLQYGITFLLCSWIAVALLRSNLLNQQEVVDSPPSPLPTWQLGSIEIVIILGTVNLLFFIAIFSSDFWVDWSSTLTHAAINSEQMANVLKGSSQAVSESCHFWKWLTGDGKLSDEVISIRCSFFQWIIIATLVIIILLLTHWLYKPASQAEEKIYQLLALMIVFMTLLIGTTVMDHLYSYTDSYGWTEARFYLFIFLRWWVVLFIWFVIILFTKKWSYFTVGTIVITLIFIGLLHFINPDARIAEVNLARLQAGKSFEINSVTSLSPDAFPIVIAQLPVLSKYHRCQLLQHIQTYQTDVFPQQSDWRGWHWTQKKTQESLQKVQPMLLLLPEEQRCD
jgi:hypothetical protein